MDKLLLDVFYYLDKSSFRQSNLKPEEEQLLLNSKLFKHGSICWPSIGCCLPGLLASLRALYRFLRIEEYEATKPAVCVKARNLKVIFQSPSNELFCHFLALAIRPFRNVNKILQSSAHMFTSRTNWWGKPSSRATWTLCLPQTDPTECDWNPVQNYWNKQNVMGVQVIGDRRLGQWILIDTLNMCTRPDLYQLDKSQRRPS